MSKGFKFSNFQSVDNMNPVVRNQQYSFNGRVFIPPINLRPQNESFTYGDNIVPKDNANYQYAGGLIPQLNANETVKPYELYKDSNNQQNTDVSIISNIVVPNALSRTYFSNDNVERIQLQIINGVYKQYNKQIRKQSYQELQIIMKSMYLQYGRNIPTNIEEQVITLNKYVVDECVKIIIPNVLQYNKYIDDISSPIPIMPRSQNVSNKGSKWGDLSSLIPQ